MKLQRICITVLLFALVALPANGQTSAVEPSNDSSVPADFESDGCTWFPDGNYRDCCVAHDKDYFKGGSCRERRESDNRLYRCVKSKKGWRNKVLAPIMWVGVRVLGTSFLPTRFRWGFGNKNKKKEERKMQKFNPPPPGGINEIKPPDSNAPADSGSEKPSPATDTKQTDIDS